MNKLEPSKMGAANILYLFVFISFNVVKSQLDVPIIETTFGPVRGVYEEDDNGQYFMYMGIPYGQYPPGNYFGDPIDPTPWDEVLNVDSDDYRCPQREEFNNTVVGSLDCLKINVYVPANRSSTETMAVYFWLHGGSFSYGCGDRYMWGPELLVRHDIILITVTYRLGPFGYLCFDTRDIPGNAGLKDILKSLKWVQENIASFGGDLDRITIGGTSSGGYAVEKLLVSPAAAGLFHRGIVQSGSVTTARNLYAENHYQEVLNMAKHLGYRGGNIQGSIMFLQSRAISNIYLASEVFAPKYTVCKERIIDGVEPFLTEIPAKLLENGNVNAYEMLIGFNSIESPFSTEPLDESMVNIFYDVFSGLQFSSDEQRETTSTNVRNFYIGSHPISEEFRANLNDMKSDNTFSYPIFKSAKLYKKQNITTYFYNFAYSGSRHFNSGLMRDIDIDGAMHADEFGYLFNQAVWVDPINADDGLIIDRMTTMWTNFVKFSDPTPEITDLLPVQWQPIVNGGLNHYLNINTEMEAGIDIHKERFAFWDLLYDTFVIY